MPAPNTAATFFIILFNSPFSILRSPMRVAVFQPKRPFSKTGGLGDVAGALPKALKASG